MLKKHSDVLIIGAGPAGTTAAALLLQRGYQVTIIEKAQFPRFSIGESLLPQCMDILDQAGLLTAVQEHGFQYKDGAVFSLAEQRTTFDFNIQFSQGWGSAYQVQRATFDKILADKATAMGAEILYEHEVLRVNFSEEYPSIECRTEKGQTQIFTAGFVLDASGFAKILPRMLAFETPSDFPSRASVFTHIEDGISDTAYDRNKIIVSIHPQMRDVWYWLIPFANGRCSLGVVAETRILNSYAGEPKQQLKQLIAENTSLSHLLTHAIYDTPVRSIIGYASNVKTLHGDGFALLGNAGEFLDPVFSSGVTIALKSASLAVDSLVKQLEGENVNWEKDFAMPLQAGINVFKCYVKAWYDGRFQDVILHSNPNPDIKKMICSILAGYVWDLNNPYVKDAERRFNVLAELCRQSQSVFI